jgi:hypothetical protein
MKTYDQTFYFFYMSIDDYVHSWDGIISKTKVYKPNKIFLREYNYQLWITLSLNSNFNEEHEPKMFSITVKSYNHKATNMILQTN